jgi:hypothetical protein
MSAGLVVVGLTAGVSAQALAPDVPGWVVEQQPGGTVTLKDGVLVINDAGGCTVWWREKMKAPVKISYRAKVTGGERVSDLNCFWMATDPRTDAHGDFFAKDSGRDGIFAHYDGLRTYYVGCGGNGNTTTRFRRYDGKGARPLLPEHDKQTEEFLLEDGREYLIEIAVTADGLTTWSRDGAVVFSYRDPEPLREGWFGFRTVWSRIEVREFKVVKPGGNSVGDAGPGVDGPG